MQEREDVVAQIEAIANELRKSGECQKWLERADAKVAEVCA